MAMWYNVRAMEDGMLGGRKSIKVYATGPHRGRLRLWLLVPGVAFAVACSESQVPEPSPEAVIPDECWNPEAPDTAECTVPQKVTVTGKNFYPSIERALDENAEFTFENNFKINLIPRDSNNIKPHSLRSIVYHNPRMLEATVPDGIPPGRYRVEVMTPFGLSGTTEGYVFTINGEPQSPSDADVDGDADGDADGDTDADADADGDPLHIDIPINHICSASQSCEDTCAGDSCGISCFSDTLCNYVCNAGQCAMECQGGGPCEMTCNTTSCELVCAGTGGCTLVCSGSQCTAANTGTNLLIVTCSAANCDVSCPTDSGGCLLSCTGEGCSPTGCAGGWRECAYNVYACNADCP